MIDSVTRLDSASTYLRTARGRRYQRRGVAAPMMAMLLVVILGFAALAVDGGRLYLARTQLQVAADSGALAAASAMLLEANHNGDYPEVVVVGTARAIDLAGRHRCLNGKTIHVANSDVTFGRIENPTNLKDPFHKNATKYNAVQVVTRRTKSSIDGPIKLTLMQVLGLDVADTSASAVVVVDDRMMGYQPQGSSGPLIPFTILDTEYDAQAASGLDEYSYDSWGDQVSLDGDGIPEVRLYPYKQKEVLDDGGGNFGVLNIGIDNQGMPPVGRQIESGVVSADLLQEVGEPEVRFLDEFDNPTSYQMTGNPGLAASLTQPISERVGDVVGFFLHSDVVWDGSNASYTIVGVRFGIVMAIDLTGNPDDKAFVIQPVPYAGPEVITDPGAPSTDGWVSQLRLAR